MITIDEAYDIIVGLNNEAHSLAWDTWEIADTLEESDDEDDWGTAEIMREEASLEQAAYFRDLFDQLSLMDKQAVFHYCNTDESFQDEFSMWYGSDEYGELISKKDDK